MNRSMRALECSGPGFVTMGSRRTSPGQAPLVFAGADELAMMTARRSRNRRIALPQDEASDSRERSRTRSRGRPLRRARNYEFRKRLAWVKGARAGELLLGLRVNQNGVALAEGAALRVLTREADRTALKAREPKASNSAKPKSMDACRGPFPRAAPGVSRFWDGRENPVAHALVHR